MTGSERPFSIGRLRTFLSACGEGPFSWRHPAAHRLFSDRLSLFLYDTRSAGEVLMGETADGVLFLPVPPPPLLRPESNDRDRGELLGALFREMAALKPGRPSPFLENCPLGALVPGSFRIEPSEREYLVAVPSLLTPRGEAGRALRWERNRFLRDHPESVVRPVTPHEAPDLRRFAAEFVRTRREAAPDALQALMAEDMGQAFERALLLGAKGEIEGWVLEEKGTLLGLQWYGRWEGGETLVCFLEARKTGVSNLGGLMTRLVLESAGSGIRWVNLMGGGGLGGVERAKRLRPHQLVLPLFRVFSD